MGEHVMAPGLKVNSMLFIWGPYQFISYQYKQLFYGYSSVRKQVFDDQYAKKQIKRLD